MATTEQKLDAILSECHQLKVKLEVSIAYQKVQENRINDHQKKIETLEASRNIALGKKSVWTIVAGGVGGVVTFLIDHLSK